MRRPSTQVDTASSANLPCIVGLFPELLAVGGVQEAGRQTAAALDEIARQRGWTLELLSLNDKPGVNTLRVEEREISFAGFGRAKNRFVLSALGHARADVPVVIAGHPHLALPAWLMKIHAPRLKTIVMAHGIEVWKPLSPLRRLALQRADRVLAPSSDTARKLAVAQSVDQEKIRKLAWPVNRAVLHLAGEPSKLPLPQAFPAGRVVLTVGRWAANERYKGTDDLIEAIAQLRRSVPDLHLVAVGGGDDLTRLRKLASDRGIADKVWYFEGLSREQLAACYARCEVFALPSAGEGFGLVFLEAMAFGKPVLGADSGGIPDLIEDGVNGLLIPAHDQQRLVKALGSLLRDSPLRARLGKQGAEIVRRKYSFAVFAHELETIIDAEMPRKPKA